MFSSRNRTLPFQPQDGMRVVCRGAVGVFDREGQMQLYVEDMQPDGVGALYVAFTQLRDRLAREGLFSEERKRPLPQYPRRIGVVTSPTGAVIRDICTTLRRRYPLAKVILAPALVQGPGAAPSIIEGIRRLTCGKDGPLVDVLIVGRGGGSLEELWPFNEESVARAIAACPVPVVSAVGHETDFTISDFVADVRAATPTAAAEIVAPHIDELSQRTVQLGQRAENALRWQLQQAQRWFAAMCQSSVFYNPKQLVENRRKQLEWMEVGLRQQALKPVRVAERRLHLVADRLHRVDMGQRIEQTRGALDKLEGRARESVQRKLYGLLNQYDRTCATLEALNPLTVLRRGYSVVYRREGDRIVASVRQLQPGDNVVIQMSDGSATARITGTEEAHHGRGVQSRLDI